LDALAGGDFSLPTTSFSSQDFSMPDYSFGSDFGGFDLGSLYDASFNPFRWGDDF
jgi:hypothetical protein